MHSLKAFIKSVLLVEVGAVVGLYLAGIALSLVEYTHYPGFFSYRIHHLDDLPVWFIATLALMVLNGIWMFRLATLEGTVRTPRENGWGNWGAAIPVNPLRLFAVNLAAIPVLLLLFLVVRKSLW